MGRCPAGGDKVSAYDMHYAVGVLMLVLALGRLGWRLLRPRHDQRRRQAGLGERRGPSSPTMLFYGCLLGCR
jgi:cytochrome b561